MTDETEKTDMSPPLEPDVPFATETELGELTRLVREFSVERDWEQFHDPKSLILALVGEVGELAELFQWIPADEAVARFSAEKRRARAGEEVADVLIYLIRLADVLGLDLGAVTRAKLADSSRRFAVHEVHGRAPEKA
jgi:NTP pyrophosphatase (non-canonical NTP hydrolase)